MTDGVTHTTNLAIPAFVDGDPEGPGRHDRNPRRCRHPVVEFDTAPEPAEVGRRRFAFDLGQVLLGDAERGVREPVGQVAVVREEQQALGVGIEAADREHARLGGHELDDGRAPVRVARRRDHTRRLVQQVVDEVGRRRDRDAVDCDPLVSRIDPTAKRRDLAVDGDPPMLDELFARPAAAVAGARQDLLEALPLSQLPL